MDIQVVSLVNPDQSTDSFTIGVLCLSNRIKHMFVLSFMLVEYILFLGKSAFLVGSTTIHVVYIPTFSAVPVPAIVRRGWVSHHT